MAKSTSYTSAGFIEQLFGDTPLRAWQKQGFDEVARRMAAPRPAGEIAAEVVLRHARRAARRES